MNYRFSSSITDAEAAEFRERLATPLASRIDGGRRILRDAEVQEEAFSKLTQEDAKGFLLCNDTKSYDYTKLADVIIAGYRTYSKEDIEAARKVMFEKYMALADKYGWDKADSEVAARREFYDNTADAAILKMLKRGESLDEYVEFVSIYG